ncbi:MAG TPA: hypothetical protein VND92_07210 [Vicinamibacterales bacterium]|nr:hypothetical protein [Vicinamibacterales bacterium]
MSPARTIALVAGAGLLAAWLAAASGARQPVPEAPAPPAAPDPQLQKVQQLLEQTTRLRDAMQAMATPRTPERNPFEFAGTPAPARADRERDDARAAAGRPALTPPAAPSPALALEGIASSTGGGSPALTAIIGGAGQLFLVKVGDLVTGRYRVTAVSAGEVDLADLQGGPPLRLTLR